MSAALCFFLGKCFDALPEHATSGLKISGFSDRHMKILKNAGYIYWVQVALVSDIDLLKVPNIGKKFVEKLRENPQGKALKGVADAAQPYLDALLTLDVVMRFPLQISAGREYLFQLDTLVEDVYSNYRLLKSLEGDEVLVLYNNRSDVGSNVKSYALVDGVKLIYTTGIGEQMRLFALLIG